MNKILKLSAIALLASSTSFNGSIAKNFNGASDCSSVSAYGALKLKVLLTKNQSEKR
jgi:hypothetical protein